MAIAFAFTEATKLNDVDPQSKLNWVLTRNADHKITRLEEFLPRTSRCNDA
ncbi:transposase domain-containing protein [Aestuariivita boseongensis]|uniref:transposase domain-containing protein n=1 Tax=Aestuariivita boseongensis TaxID=1470562 RepID=UPI0012FA07F1